MVVAGTIQGSAIAIAGDVIIREGGRVTGDAVAAFGKVTQATGSTVGGATRSLTGTWGASVRSLLGADQPSAVPATPRSPLLLAVGWLGVLLLIGIGVLVFASSYLEGVVDVLEGSFWRSFLIGVAGQLGVVPALLVLCILLAVSIIGVLLIPFGIVAFVLAVAGLIALGYIAVARLVGGAFAGRGGAATDQGRTLRGIVTGVFLLQGLWVLAMALRAVPAGGLAAKLLAMAVTYVAATAGFGAALLSRAGTRRELAVEQRSVEAAQAWQTPTPIGGVAAARRPKVHAADRAS